MTYNNILCLAHYCDHHGPTPLMVTEGLQTACSTCFEEPVKSNGPPRSTPSGNLQDAKGPRSGSLAASQHEGRSRRSAMRSPPARSPTSSPALETPPESPRSVYQQNAGRESNFRRTYDETVTKKQGPCDNCAMTLPRRQNSPKTPSDNTPTLRTRAPAERVYGSPARDASPRSQCSSDTDGDRDLPRRPRARTSAQPGSSRTTSCSSTSTTSDRASSHVHYIDYTSTHEPVLGHSFSLIRASCLRALSFETLPRPPATSPISLPQPNSAPAFVTTQSAGSAATGGPIFFGDAVAGYTTAYIFRIPDLHARGHKRVYAFLALSTHKERLAMKTYTVVSNAFRDLAGWVQQLVEAEAERVADPLTTGGANGNLGSANGSPAPPNQSALGSPVTVDRSASSFLSGGSGLTRRMGASGSASSLKARGLAELAGQPDIFIELHKRFVQLLFEIGVALNS